MEAKEMKDKYRNLYNTMATSRKVENMKLFGMAFTDLFDNVADAHPELALQTLNILEAINYDNYLTEEEAVYILNGLINHDNSKGAKWTQQQIRQYLSDKNFVECEEGAYNFHALVVTMNMLYSVYAVQLTQMLDGNKEDIPFWIYRMSIARLKDKTRPCWIRRYFLE